MDAVAQIRRFNRTVTQQIGALASEFLGRDHPLGASLGSASVLILIAVSVAALAVARAHEDELRANVLRTNAYAARAMAGAVLFELRRLALGVEDCAANPAARPKRRQTPPL